MPDGQANDQPANHHVSEQSARRYRQIFATSIVFNASNTMPAATAGNSVKTHRSSLSSCCKPVLPEKFHQNTAGRLQEGQSPVSGQLRTNPSLQAAARSVAVAPNRPRANTHRAGPSRPKANAINLLGDIKRLKAATFDRLGQRAPVRVWDGSP